MACHYPTGDNELVRGREYLLGRSGRVFWRLVRVNRLTGICLVSRHSSSDFQWTSVGTLQSMEWRPGGYHESPPRFR